MSYETMFLFSFLYPYRIRKLGLCAKFHLISLYLHNWRHLHWNIFRQFRKRSIFFLILWWPCCILPKFFVFLILMDQWVSWNSFVGKPAEFVRVLVVRTIFICDSFFQRKVWCQRRHHNVLQEPKHKHLRLWKIRQLLIRFVGPYAFHCIL